jgi:2-aminoethylphosphonate-pyruvate transaminase
MIKIPAIKRNILLNPGPATTTDTVKLAQLVPDICPREKDFGDLMQKISTELTSFVANHDEYATVLFGGSGTAAVESVICSVVPESKTILIVNNGSYGKRMCEMAEAHSIDFYEFKSSEIAPIDIKLLEDCIKKDHSRFSHLAVVHNETTTGLLNDISALGDLAKKYNLEFIVDAMSSYGAIPIDMNFSSIKYLIASSNKNLQGMAGIGFVVANRKSIYQLKDVKGKGYYLDLYSQFNYFQKQHQMRFTPPVQVAYALYQAILETKNEGIANRYKRYSHSWKVLIKGLNELGLSYLVDDEFHSRIITAIVLPKSIEFNSMHSYFKAKGITIYPGKIEHHESFRIANIGAIDHQDVELFIKHLKKFLKMAS